MNMDRMNIRQESKQQPMDNQNQTWARQVLSKTGLKTALVTSTIVLHLKIEIKKIDDRYAHELCSFLSL